METIERYALRRGTRTATIRDTTNNQVAALLTRTRVGWQARLIQAGTTLHPTGPDETLDQAANRAQDTLHKLNPSATTGIGEDDNEDDNLTDKKIDEAIQKARKEVTGTAVTARAAKHLKKKTSYGLDVLIPAIRLRLNNSH